MAYTWTKGAKDMPSARKTQYFEMLGNRAIYHDGWIASTTPPAGPWLMGLGTLPDVIDGYNWELYNLNDDYSQFNDLAAKEPDKLRDMQQLFLVEAAKYQVLPLDNSVAARLLAPRPSATAGRNEFVYTSELSGLPAASAPSPLNRSYTLTADVEVPEGGGDGMLATLGGRFGGYGLYLIKGKPVFTYNLLALERFRWAGEQALTPGKHTVAFDFTYDGPGFGKGGRGVLSVDGSKVAERSIPHTIPFLMTIDESFDVGVDTRTSVDDEDYQVPFRFTGMLDKVTVKVGPPQL
ncbi:arylsulfatase [Rhizobium favelukesii]|uniref:Arylsulfatase n=1 Tax=Rhizobium favelukesii TaxID=348824 RepID=W6R4U5_9HYPH|nr:arylsulfatase [Rhizobium favelukesii]